MRFIVKEWKKINWAIGLLKKKVVKLQIIHCFMISKGGLHAFRPWLFPCLFIIFRFSFCLLNDKAFFFLSVPNPTRLDFDGFYYPLGYSIVINR